MNTPKPNGAEKEPAIAPPPSASKETLRRTRGSAPSRGQSASKASSHANGSANHAAAADGPTRPGSRVNGHGHAFSSDSVEATRSPHSLQAGSDDASGASVAIAASNGAAGADRDACAAPAERAKEKKRHSSSTLLCGRVSGFVLANPDSNEEQPRVPSEVTVVDTALADKIAGKSAADAPKHSPGEEPLPADPADFVEEVHARVDLIRKWEELLKSEDEKIKQRAVEKLTEMRYKGAQSLAEEPQQVVFELTRTKRDG